MRHKAAEGDRRIDRPLSATSSAACLGQVYAHNAGDCRATHGLTRALGDADTRRHRAIAANDRPSRRDIMGLPDSVMCRLRPFIADHRCVWFMRINAAGRQNVTLRHARSRRRLRVAHSPRSLRFARRRPTRSQPSSSLRPLRSLCAQTPRLADSPIRPGKGRATRCPRDEQVPGDVAREDHSTTQPITPLSQLRHLQHAAPTSYPSSPLRLCA